MLSVWLPRFLLASLAALLAASTLAQPALPTILLAGQAATWTDLEKPPYNAAITIKTKLERTGFHVIFDATQSHQHVLVLTYLETEGREYGKLQRGTEITCEFTFWQITSGAPEKRWSQTVKAGTSWPTPIGSPYWDAVRNLEENPYYYYIGEFALALATGQDDAGTVFTKALAQKKLTGSAFDGGGVQASGHVVANEEARLNAMRELGRMKDRRALPVLWEIIEQGGRSDEGTDAAQRETALRAIGEIGDPSSLDRLNMIFNTHTDESVRAVTDKAITRIREQNLH